MENVLFISIPWFQLFCVTITGRMIFSPLNCSSRNGKLSDMKKKTVVIKEKNCGRRNRCNKMVNIIFFEKILLPAARRNRMSTVCKFICWYMWVSCWKLIYTDKSVSLIINKTTPRNEKIQCEVKIEEVERKVDQRNIKRKNRISKSI